MKRGRRPKKAAESEEDNSNQRRTITLFKDPNLECKACPFHVIH